MYCFSLKITLQEIWWILSICLTQNRVSCLKSRLLTQLVKSMKTAGQQVPADGNTNGAHKKQRNLFSELTQSQPELAGPWVNLGHIHLQHGKPEAAQTSFEQALRANPFNCDAHNQLGVMARRDGRFTDAETHYLDCLQADPGYGRARLNLGILYELYMGRLGEALATYHDYQANLIEPDARVNGWVMDLERRVAAIAKR